MGTDTATGGDVLARLGVIGLSHRTAPLDLRDRIAPEEAAAALWIERLRGVAEELLVLATCDRIEVHLADADPIAAVAGVEARFAEAAATPDLAGHIFRRFGVDAARHLFQVAAAIDSAVVGEPQVLGQLRDADRRARLAGGIGPRLELVLSAAYAAAKRVRSETAIGQRPVSLAAAAVRVARDIHGDLGTATVLVVGPGEMGELLADAFQRAGAGRLAVADVARPRSAAAAARMAAALVSYDPPAPALAGADIVVTAAGLGRRAIRVEDMTEALRRRRRRPVFVVDASIPEDADPAIQDLDGAFLYTIADLERVALDGQATRAAAAAAADAIIGDEIERLLTRLRSRDAAVAIQLLADRFEAARQTALADAGGDAERATHLLVRRLLHGPNLELRALADSDPASRIVAEQLLARLFGTRTESDT